MERQRRMEEEEGRGVKEREVKERAAGKDRGGEEGRN